MLQSNVVPQALLTSELFIAPMEKVPLSETRQVTRACLLIVASQQA